MEKIKRFFSEQDHFARHTGIELLRVEPGKAWASLQIAPCHLNGAKTVHGGAILTLADFAFAVASNSHGNLAMGINTSTSFLRAATQGTLYAAAEEISINRKLSSYQVRITDQEDNLIALFQGTAYRKTESIIPSESL
ncbi:PaaI family thioesterase [Geopsychrobacter electrodiphilus]|uniref:PaaI family thioesterase n=1 Tax=Geopsychrobacter electrodiphilus TaxID=225196 RepID=UPI000370B402|nr:PaaI family thioesterase [Geopsychrobacter electrodiphilus]